MKSVGATQGLLLIVDGDRGPGVSSQLSYPSMGVMGDVILPLIANDMKTEWYKQRDKE